MTTYIGTATSRIDGRAKVTGAARYAGEYNTSGLAHASLVTSTIAKGRIARIDANEALSVSGVIDVLTHQHRPPMASTDSAYKDDVAPEGSPFRPLYNDRIWFCGQPIALVVAEESEIARFAASLVRVDDIVNPLGIKGLGEIGIVGVAAAIANAIYHATGKRVRDLPVTLDKLMRATS